MSRRFVSIWCCHLLTDWFYPPPAGAAGPPAGTGGARSWPDEITAANYAAQVQGISAGMAVADARALLTTLQVLDDVPDCLSGC